MPVPDNPKIYHIVHVDRLTSIIQDACLWSDAEIAQRRATGTTIGMNNIKAARLTQRILNSHPGLHVGECVPFYFCPRSVMLYVIHQANHPELAYRGGQGPILHLEADLRRVVTWAGLENRRWAFTSANAGSRYFDDYDDLEYLDRLNWDAIAATSWADNRDGKQAEFLMEQSFPWHLVDRIGTRTRPVHDQVRRLLQTTDHRPLVEIRQNWYY